MNELLENLTSPLVLPITIALVAGALAYMLARWSPVLCKLIALAASAGVLAGGIMILLASPEVYKWVWVEQLAKGLPQSISLSVELASSTLGMVVLIGAAAFALLITIYSFRAMAGEYWEGKFYAYLIWALGGACVVALAGNLLVLLVGWEIVTLMLFLMINQGRREAKAGAAKTYGMLGFADACLLLAVVLLAATGGSASWSLAGGPKSVADMGAMGYVVYVLIMVAALAKAGAIPLHTWIPAIAKDAPAPVMAYLPAALDKLLGIYLLAVLSLRMFRPDPTMQTVMMIIGGVTIIAAVLMAMVQHNLKRLLSFHAVSQVGYMVLGIGTGTTIGVIGGLFHMLNHAIYKCNLFLMSGTVGRATGSDEIEDMGGLAKALPVTFVCGLISAAAISGVPPFNGFASKWMVYQGALEVGRQGAGGLAIGLVIVAVFGSALTLASFVKVLYAAFLSPAPKGLTHAVRAKESFLLAAPMVVLAVACVGLGLFPSVAINHIFAPAIADAATTGQDVAANRFLVDTGGLGLWSSAPAAGLILIGILLGLIWLWMARTFRSVRIVRPFLSGEVPAANDDRFRVPATHFYETIAKLPLIGPLLFHGQQGAMDPYHWSARHGKTFVELLRSAHTGLISLYVAWCVLGLTATLIYLLVCART